MEIFNTYEKPTEYGYRKLTVYYDFEPMNPRTEWDNLGKMICLHSRYDLGDKHSFRDNEDIQEYIKENKITSILPLFLYDHSGITISTGSFYSPWDSGQVGYIWITDEKIRNEYGVKRISKKLRLKILEYLESEVNTYDQYLTGDVYGFEVTEFTRVNPKGDLEENETDSCWGFYGSDFEANGLFESADFQGVS